MVCVCVCVLWQQDKCISQCLLPCVAAVLRIDQPSSIWSVMVLWWDISIAGWCRDGPYVWNACIRMNIAPLSSFCPLFCFGFSGLITPKNLKMRWMSRKPWNIGPTWNTGGNSIRWINKSVFNSEKSCLAVLSHSCVPKWITNVSVGKYQNAIEDYRACLSLVPSSNLSLKRDVLESIARCYSRLGARQQALEICEKLVNEL